MYCEALGDLAIRQAYYGTTNLTLYLVDDRQRLWTYRYGVLREIASRVALIRGAGDAIDCAQLNAGGQAVAIRQYDDGTWKTLCPAAAAGARGGFGDR